MARVSGEDYRAWAEFRYQVRAWTRLSEEAASTAGLPPQHYQLLLAIKGFPGDEPPRITDLAERLQLRHHSIVGLLDRMEKRGLIERTPLFGRAVSVSLTPEGVRLLNSISAKIRPQLRAAAAELMDALAMLVDEPAPSASKRGRARGIRVVEGRALRPARSRAT